MRPRLLERQTETRDQDREFRMEGLQAKPPAACAACRSTEVHAELSHCEAWAIGRADCGEVQGSRDNMQTEPADINDGTGASKS